MNMQTKMIGIDNGEDSIFFADKAALVRLLHGNEFWDQPPRYPGRWRYKNGDIDDSWMFLLENLDTITDDEGADLEIDERFTFDRENLDEEEMPFLWHFVPIS